MSWPRRYASGSLHTMGKGVTSNGSKSCEDCALHCSTRCTTHQVDVPARFLPLKNSWIMDCTLGIQVEPPTSNKSCTFFSSTSLSRRHFSTKK